MINNLSSGSYPEDRTGKHIRLNNFFPRAAPALASVLCLLFSVLFFSACATIPDPEDIKKADAYNKLGSSYLNNGQLNEAFVKFQIALDLDPKNKETLNYLGYISARFKKYDDAVSYYERAISVDPNYSDAINNLGVTYAELEDWDKAIQHFKDALNNPMYRTPDWAYSNLGYAYYKQGNYTEAENALREALVRNPVFPGAMYILGLVYTERGNEKAAIKEFKKAIGILPDYMDAHWELANAYLRLGEKARALKHFRVVAEKDENTARSRDASDYIERLKY
ncbi:MAG TPA: tetratricopeptide repeat protein [Nitrospirae bacterium]|nr:tetratricopeptide repeat protein [Nitrospirota bacterium]HDZ03174.1 tetratricopeptide repeat protein [Nitrospirota bacterium]